jgi:hypothetical protein
MWKEAVIAQFNALLQNSPQRLRGTMKTSFKTADALADIHTGISWIQVRGRLESGHLYIQK